MTRGVKLNEELSTTDKRLFIMKKVMFFAALIVGSMAISSCVSKKDLENCQNENKELSAQYQNSRESLAAANARINSLSDQLKSCQNNNDALAKSLEQSLNNANSSSVNVAKLVDQINESNQYIRHLIEVKSKSDSLNLVLTNNLTRSLSKEDMKDVDIQVLKGVVYISLSDNMLYKSGSYQISSAADATLSKIAKIIMDYPDYDVLIEGNTDNVPISQTNIRNNWDLSCLRASSVVQALQTKFGVDPKRLTAAGRGEYNPIADNASVAGKNKNRRTQIIITPKLDQFMELIGKAPQENNQ